MLGSLSGANLDEWFRGFGNISLAPALEDFDWVNRPAQFVERESAYLWTTGQQDAFGETARAYGARLMAAAPPSHPPVQRLGIAIIGQGVASYDAPSFAVSARMEPTSAR